MPGMLDWCEIYFVEIASPDMLLDMLKQGAFCILYRGREMIRQ